MNRPEGIILTAPKQTSFNSIKIEPEAMQFIQELKGENKPLFFPKKIQHAAKFFQIHQQIPQALLLLNRNPWIFPWLCPLYTWATIAYNELDIDELTIDVALGHKTSKTIAGTFYIKKARTKVDETNRKMIDYLIWGSLLLFY